jgi:hypothetical protein
MRTPGGRQGQRQIFFEQKWGLYTLLDIVLGPDIEARIAESYYGWLAADRLRALHGRLMQQAINTEQSPWGSKSLVNRAGKALREGRDLTEVEIDGAPRMAMF